MDNLVIVGAGGFGREVAWMVERINQINPTWNVLGFIDDNVKTHGSIIDGHSVLGGLDWVLANKSKVFAVCAIGTSRIRREVITRLEGVRFASLIDPNVIMSDKVRIGEGSIICAGTIITVNITLGAHTIINLDCTVGHDAILHDFVTLYPSVNISGNTELKECVEIGTGSQIIQGLTIGNETIVGAGAVAVKDLPNKCTAVGIPAKPVKYHEID